MQVHRDEASPEKRLHTTHDIFQCPKNHSPTTNRTRMVSTTIRQLTPGRAPRGGHRFAAAYKEQSLNMVFRQETCSRILLQSHGSPRSFFFRAHRAFATSRSIRVRAQSSISNSSQKGSERSGTSTTGVVFFTGMSSMWYVTSSLLHLGNDGTALS